MTGDPALRQASGGDLAGVTACSRRAYQTYVERLGYEPKPMLADYTAFLSVGAVWVLEQTRVIVGVLVLEEEDNHLLIYSVAVDPAVQGRGHGRRLMAFAEADAQRRGLAETRLYTNERMIENQRFYASLGYHVFDRRPHTTRPNAWLIHMRRSLPDK